MTDSLKGETSAQTVNFNPSSEAYDTNIRRELVLSNVNEVTENIQNMSAIDAIPLKGETSQNVNFSLSSEAHDTNMHRELVATNEAIERTSSEDVFCPSSEPYDTNIRRELVLSNVNEVTENIQNMPAIDAIPLKGETSQNVNFSLSSEAHDTNMCREVQSTPQATQTASRLRSSGIVGTNIQDFTESEIFDKDEAVESIGEPTFFLLLKGWKVETRKRKNENLTCFIVMIHRGRCFVPALKLKK